MRVFKVYYNIPGVLLNEVLSDHLKITNSPRPTIQTLKLDVLSVLLPVRLDRLVKPL